MNNQDKIAIHKLRLLSIPEILKKVYQKPQLQILGDLRSLTLGASGPDFDSGTGDYSETLF